jgi:hypothetical protein
MARAVRPPAPGRPCRRRLEVTSRASDTAHGLEGTNHAVLEFRDFGAHERVTAPPASQVYRLPTPEEIKARRHP